MTDARLRALEAQFHAGDQGAALPLIRELRRQGQLDGARVELWPEMMGSVVRTGHTLKRFVQYSQNPDHPRGLTPEELDEASYRLARIEGRDDYRERRRREITAQQNEALAATVATARNRERRRLKGRVVSAQRALSRAQERHAEQLRVIGTMPAWANAGPGGHALQAVLSRLQIRVMDWAEKLDRREAELGKFLTEDEAEEVDSE